MTRLILVRHGETEENFRNITQGHLPGKLSRKGIQQASKVASQLCKSKIDIIYSSDLRRAVHTAEIIGRKCKAPIILMQDLRERNHGIFQGRSKEHLHQAFSTSKLPWHKYRPPDGETFIEMKNRVLKSLRKIANQEMGKSVGIITHGGPILAIAAHISNHPMEKAIELRPDNTGITIIEYEAGKFRMIAHNQTGHLD